INSSSSSFVAIVSSSGQVIFSVLPICRPHDVLRFLKKQASLTNLVNHLAVQMLKPPKIVITNIDEDPSVRRNRHRQKIAEICALCCILLINWIMAISKSCSVFGIFGGIITSVITLMQYCLLVKTSFAVHFRPKVTTAKPPHYQEHLSLVNSLRWTAGGLARCCTCVQTRLGSKVAATQPS
ncbi:hypothetical protein TYRP_008035, partial [Tyrophagus putrescentiae]